MGGVLLLAPTIFRYPRPVIGNIYLLNKGGKMGGFFLRNKSPNIGNKIERVSEVTLH